MGREADGKLQSAAASLKSVMLIADFIARDAATRRAKVTAVNTRLERSQIAERIGRRRVAPINAHKIAPTQKASIVKRRT
jgi:hypothetical protein